MGKRRMLNVPLVAAEVRTATAWAWAIPVGPDGWSLCQWTEPSRDKLMKTAPPSEGSRPVRVRLTAIGRTRLAHPTPAEPR